MHIHTRAYSHMRSCFLEGKPKYQVKGSIILSEYSVVRLTKEWRNAILLYPKDDAQKRKRLRTARFDREIHEGGKSPMDTTAFDLRNDLQKKKYAMLLRSEKQASDWTQAFKTANEETKKMEKEQEREEEERERREEEGGEKEREHVAFTVTSHVGADQAKLIDLKSRIEGFAKVMGVGFNQVGETFAFALFQSSPF